jgi:hypothetical protein
MQHTDTIAAPSGSPLARPREPSFAGVIETDRPRAIDDEPAKAGKRQRTFALLLLTLSIPVLLLVMHRIDDAMLARINGTLSKLSGLPVQIGSISATFGPGVTLHDVSFGQVLDVQRVDVTFTLDGVRPRVDKIRLIRPSIEVKGQTAGLVKREKRNGRKAAARLAKRSGGKWTKLLRNLRRAQISVHDGTLSLNTQIRGRPAQLRAQQIFVKPLLSRYRIVTGPVAIRVGDIARVDLASSAIEIDRSLKIQRGAFLAGNLVLGTARLKLLQGRLERIASKLSLKLQARPEHHLSKKRCAGCKQQSEGTATLYARATIVPPAMGEPLKKATVNKVELALKGHPIAAFEPLFAGRAKRLSGRASGSLVFSREDRQRVYFSTDLTITQLKMTAASLAPRPLIFARVALAARGSLDPGSIQINRLTLKSGKLALNSQLTYRFSPRRARFSLEMPAVPCQHVLTALPDGFAPRLDGLVTAGKIGVRGQLDVSWPANEKRDVANLSLTPFSCRVVRDPDSADVHQLERGKAFDLRGWDAKGRRISIALDKRDPRFYPLLRIPRTVRDAFVGAEDARFYTHDGFARSQISRAFLHNLHVGRFSRGASTISQQVVKNLLLDQSRNLSRKFQEAVLTWRMEQVLSKGRILELYLNLVEMAPGIYGVGRAAPHLFGKKLGRLNPLQVAHLAALTPSPRRFSRRFAKQAPGPKWRAKLAQLLFVMSRRGAIRKQAAARWAKARLYLR